MKLSIVTTMYCSAPYLDEFYKRTCAAAEKVTNDFEIIFVNDGSPDESLEIILGYFNRDKRIRIIDLSRNFGHHQAAMTGLAHAKGDMIFLIDCDLEENPEWLEMFYGEMEKTGADVVFGAQIARKGQLFERVTGKIFYHLFNLLSQYSLPDNFLTVRLMKRKYVSSLLEHKERELFLGGICVLTGYKQIAVRVNKGFRAGSTYSLKRKVSLFVSSITSFSNKPLLYIFYLGTIISFVSCIATIFIILNKILFGGLLLGWPSLIASIWFMCGMIIFCLGIIGIYLSKIFMETKQRPLTIVKVDYCHKNKPDNEICCTKPTT